MSVRVGIVAIQGDIEAHANALERVGAVACPVLREKDLVQVDALVLPGGESTTISKGLDRLGLYGPLEEFGRSGRPVLGTCAGAILLARASENHPVRTLGLLDFSALRNAYGTQVDSFIATVDAPPAGSSDEIPGLENLRCVFIRAPRFVDLGEAVEVLARVDGAPVWVRQGNVQACSFHPELTDDPLVHRMLLKGL